MVDRIQLNVQQREITGRKTKILRRDGFVPAVVYGRGFKPQNIQVPARDFEQVYAEAGESTIVYIKLNDKEIPTIIHEVAHDPVSDEVLHADFYKIRLDEKITADIPVVITGISPAIKDFGGILVKNINELEVEALPQDLPHEFTVDVSGLKNIDDHITVSQLSVSDKVKIKANPDDMVVLVQEPAKEEEEAPAEVSVEDVEVGEKKEEEEGEEGEGEKGEENEKKEE